MNIAIFTKNNETSDLLSCLFDQYSQQQCTEINYKLFNNEIDLISDFVPGTYDALFWDAIAITCVLEELRSKDHKLRFLYLISSDCAGTPLPIPAWYFLPKPLDEHFLFNILDRLCEEVHKETQTGIAIKSKGVIMHLLFSKIEYVEVIGRKILFHLTDGQIESVTGIFSDYEERLLIWPYFYKIHRAFLVNLHYIIKLTTDSLIMQSGDFLPVSRLHYSNLKKSYLNELMLPEDELATPIPSTNINTTSNYEILFVDDEETVCNYWGNLLLEKGCIVYTAVSADIALDMATQKHVDCVILDVNLGEHCGFDLCSKLTEKTGAPVVFFSSLSDTEHQEKGFLTGGIDYITKDISRELFWLKIESRLKIGSALRTELCVGQLRLALKQRQAFWHKEPIALTTVEFDILYHLMQNPNTTYSPIRLHELIWGDTHRSASQTIQLHITQLCRKLNHITGYKLIEAVWGSGYRFVSTFPTERR